MKVYISGPIKGKPDGNVSAFNHRDHQLTSLGHIAINPHKILPYAPTLSYADYMKADIIALLACDAITFLDGWESSNGAKLEAAIANACDIPLLADVK